jgi:RHS repeat-associated protein/uncharacterized repeat protein (TIGR01451 family)
VDGGTVLVPGSVQPSQGTGSVSGSIATAELGSLAVGAEASVTFEVQVRNDLQAGIYAVSNQARIESNERRPLRTDDPDAAGAVDPTVTPVVRTAGPAPELVATKTDTLTVDADGDGLVTPGDTLSYELRVSNVGAGSATGVRLTDTPDPDAPLLAGSVQATGYAVESGNGTNDRDVAVALGSIAPGTSATLTFQAKVREDIAPGITSVRNQASVASVEVAPVLSQDPDGATPGGATETPVNPPPRKPPALTGFGPADGTAVTEPTPITGTLAPPPGQRIESWCVTAELVGGEAERELECGTGTPPEGPLATFDPTVLPNGAYEVTVTAQASGGGELTKTLTLSVEGSLKPARFKATYRDLAVPVVDLPMQVMRTYDSFDKEKGDFGVGWNAEIANMRVQVNRPLGRGGWSFQPRNCRILLGYPVCEGTEFKDLSSHFVTVTWPDGRSEVFDFKPTSDSAGVYFDANVAYKARRGVTSTIEPLEGGQVLQYWGDGNLYQDDGQTLYDPRRFKLTTKDGQVLTLSVERGLEKLEDRRGQSLTIDDTGVRSSTGKSIDFERDGEGRISKISGPSGETYEYTYSAAGNLSTVKDANGRTVAYEYDAEHNLRHQKDPTGRAFQTLSYDADGRLGAITDGEGNTTRIETNVDERQEIIHDAASRLTTVLTSSSLGDLISKQEIAAGTSRTTTYDYDTNGNLTRTTDPLGHDIRATYDDRGNRLTETDELGRTTAFEYNEFGQLSRVVRPDGVAALEATYNDWGDLIELNTGSGRVTKFSYDDFGNQVKEIDAQGRVTTMSYDGSGNRTRAEMGASWSTMTYDASNRLKSITDSRTARTELVYDGDGRVLTRTQPLGFAVNYRYDYRGRLISETDPLGRTSEYTYDSAGRLTARKDRNGVETTYEYDSNGRLVRANLPDGRVNTIVYDAFGHAKEMTNRDAALTFGRDAANRLTSITTTGVGDSEQPSTAVEYEYDAAGQPVSMKTPAGTIRYEYDHLGQLKTLTDIDGGKFGWERDLAGRATQLSRPNGVSTATSWDLLDQPTRVSQVSPDATPLDDVQYRYESPVGLMSQMIDRRGATNFSYDTRGYLTTADYPITAPSDAQPDESYGYDLNGNQSQGFKKYDTAGRLYENPDYYGYDAEGNQAWRAPKAAPYPKTNFVWDAEGQLRRVENPDGTTKASYRYDPLGRRIEVSTPQGTKRFAYGIDDNALVEYDAQNALAAVNTFEHGLDRPLARHATGRTYYQLQDGLDNVSTLTDESGQVVERYRYGVYGQPVGNVASGRNSFTFAGREWDPGSSSYYFRARYYDPVNGRFLSEDPEVSGNPYLYAGNNPLQNRDPTGRIYGYAEALSEMQIREELAAIEQHQVTGQVHHAISRSVWRALERNPNLRGNYTARDPRFTTRAKDAGAHRGYQSWHRRLDDEVAKKIDDNPWWEPKDFEAYLRGRYQVLDLLARFPLGLPP